MAAGEYVSVPVATGDVEHQIGASGTSCGNTRNRRRRSCRCIYQARGLAKPDADRAVTHLIADPDRALDTLAREELGSTRRARIAVRRGPVVVRGVRGRGVGSAGALRPRRRAAPRARRVGDPDGGRAVRDWLRDRACSLAGRPAQRRPDAAHRRRGGRRDLRDRPARRRRRGPRRSNAARRGRGAARPAHAPHKRPELDVRSTTSCRGLRAYSWSFDGAGGSRCPASPVVVRAPYRAQRRSIPRRRSSPRAPSRQMPPSCGRRRKAGFRVDVNDDEARRA